MKKIVKNTFVALTVIILGASCTKLEYDREYSATYPISGDWTITVSDGTNSYGPYFMKIYNTANSKDSVWIDDAEQFWQTKTKCAVNMSNLTFATERALNEYYESEVSYFNGKIINNDSIYFEVKYNDDGDTEEWEGDETTWIFSGHRKESYEEYNTH